MPFELICLLYIVGIVILVAELFAPGGFLGFVGMAVVITSIVLAFIEGNTIQGISLILISFVAIPSIFIWGLRRVKLSSSQNVEDGYVSTQDGLDDLLGKEGHALTLLRPAGLALINGKRIDCVSEGVMIEKDTPVKVVKVEGNQVIVRSLQKS